MSTRNRLTALGLAGALALGATISASAGPVPVGTAAAVKDATAKAQELAEAAGIQLGELQSVSFLDNQPYPMFDGKGGGGGAVERSVGSGSGTHSCVSEITRPSLVYAMTSKIQPNTIPDGSVNVAPLASQRFSRLPIPVPGSGVAT